MQHDATSNKVQQAQAEVRLQRCAEAIVSCGRQPERLL